MYYYMPSGCPYPNYNYNASNNAGGAGWIWAILIVLFILFFLFWGNGNNCCSGCNCKGCHNQF